MRLSLTLKWQEIKTLLALQLSKINFNEHDRDKHLRPLFKV